MAGTDKPRRERIGLIFGLFDGYAPVFDWMLILILISISIAILIRSVFPYLMLEAQG